MIASDQAYAYDCPTARRFELGVLGDDQLAVLSLLIRCRRALPVYLGDVWRCYACGFERADLSIVARHILETHEPEPVNEEDIVESRPGRRLPV